MKFDEFYSRQENYFSGGHSGGMEECISKFNIKPTKAVDLGAGEGRNSYFLAKSGFDVIAIEPSIVGAQKISKINELVNNRISIYNLAFLDCVNEINDIGFLVALTSLEHMEYKYMLESIKAIKRIMRIGGIVYIMVFTEDDPGFKSDLVNASECSLFIKHYFKKNELKGLFNDFEILHYSEYIKEDHDHGPIHLHGKAKLCAKKI